MMVIIALATRAATAGLSLPMDLPNRVWAEAVKKAAMSAI
jgi:hypothetical protein